MAMTIANNAPLRKSSHFHLIFLIFCFLVATSFLFQSSRLLRLGDERFSVLHSSEDPQQQQQQQQQQRAIFYNIYIPTAPEKKYRAMSIVKEQLRVKASSNLAASAPVYYTVIGWNATDEIQEACGTNNDCHALRYVEQGDEGLTLQSLYEYCLEHDDALVTYIHDKGSLHPTPKNRHLRTLLTKGAFADDCQQKERLLQDNDCNVCGARFSPFPHMHMAGNMWTAKCSYVQQLIPPRDFTAKMEGLMQFVMEESRRDTSIPRPTFQQFQDEYFVGRQRFAFEHWIGSHPSVQPCDIYPGKYLCGYIDLPHSSEEWKADLQPAPRFPVSEFQKRAAKGNWFCGQARLLEFEWLYHQGPPSSSFVWSFYNEAFKTCPIPLNRQDHEHLFSNRTRTTTSSSITTK
jgi:hypothetical protein